MSRATSSLVVAALAVGVLSGVLLERHEPCDARPERVVEFPVRAPLLSLSFTTLSPARPVCVSCVDEPTARAPEAAPQAQPKEEEARVDEAPPRKATAEPGCRPRHMRASNIPVVAPPIEVAEIAVSDWDVRLLAVHDGQHVMLSPDEGRTWQSVLDVSREEIERPAVIDMGFDCASRLHVLRAGGSLGTHNPASGTEVWDPIEVLAAAEDAKLLIDRLDVTALGPDPARLDQLILVGRDDVLGWSPTAVFADDSDGWDGVNIDHVESRGSGRFKAWVSPWKGGECGWSAYAELHVNTRTQRARSVSRGDESEEHPDWPQSYNTPVVDAAGRVLVADPDDNSTLLRLSRAEYTEWIDEDAA